MGKEKKAIIEQERKDLTFYYEIVGIIAILISTIALARLGKIGHYFMITFRVVFGDWYFIFLIALLLYGIRSLLLHRPLNLKNMRSIGIILLMIGILILSHFPMHNYIKGFGTAYYSMTMQLYLDYFKNYHDGMVVGGGVIGSSFFYLFYLMFSSVGTIIITLILLFVGISFTCRKTVAEFISFIGKFFLGFFKKTKGLMKTLKYDIDINPSPKKRVEKSKRNIKIESLKSFEVEDYSAVEEKHAEGVKRTIANVLNNMNIFYNDINYIISHHITSYVIITIASVSLEAMNLKLKKVLVNNFLIKKKIKDNKIIIEVDNLQKKEIDLKKTLLSHKTNLNNNEYIIGYNTFNEVVKINLQKNANFLLVGSKGAINLLNSLLITTYFKKPAPINITIIDLDNLLFRWKNTFCFNQEKSVLEEIKHKMDERLNELHKYSLNSQEEYNKSVHKEIVMTQEIIIISGFGQMVLKERVKEALMYLLQIGKQCGYAFFCLTKTEDEIPTTINSLIESKFIFYSDLLYATKLLGFNGSQLLDTEGEMFYLFRDEVERISIVQTIDENIDLICTKINKN